MTDQTVSDIVGANIRSLRDQNRWTRDELAARCAERFTPPLTAAMITNIELGKRDKQGNRRRDITVDELIVLADAFSVPPAALLPALAGGVEDVTWQRDSQNMIDRLAAFERHMESLKERGMRGIFKSPSARLHPNHPETQPAGFKVPDED